MQIEENPVSKHEVSRADCKTKLQFCRKRKALTQRDLAKLAQVNLRTLQAYEQGRKQINRASWDTVSRLADVLGVDPKDILEE